MPASRHFAVCSILADVSLKADMSAVKNMTSNDHFHMVEISAGNFGILISVSNSPDIKTEASKPYRL